MSVLLTIKTTKATKQRCMYHLKADSRTHINDMMSDLKWLTIEQRRKLYIYVMIYTVMNSLAPNYLCKYFTKLPDRNIIRGNIRGMFEIPTL